MPEKPDFTKDTGPAGPPGDQGDPGPAGDTGLQGDQGDPGPTGDTGLQGDQGDQGDQGETGPPGTTTWAGITDKPTEFNPEDHHEDHESGGSGEMSVAALEGELADEQDSGKIKGVIIDDSAKADGKLLGFVSASGKVEYI